MTTPPMNILVTGAAGRLGRAVADDLEQQGHQVHRTDKVLGRRGKPGRIAQVEPKPADQKPIDLADLTDEMTCYRLLQGKDAVVHFGNVPLFWEGVHRAQEVYTQNTSININMFTAAGECGVKKIVFASSIQTMIGDRLYREGRPLPPSGHLSLPLSERSQVNPLNPYSLSKLAGEQALSWACYKFNTQGVSLRITYVVHNQEPVLATASEHHNDEPNDWELLDEVFGYLAIPDLTSLVRAVLSTNLPGHRVYVPASLGTRIRMHASQIKERFFPNVELTCPMEQIDELGFFDTSTITRDTGWKPTFRLHPR